MSCGTIMVFRDLKGGCKYCGKPLRLTRRLTGSRFCSVSHEQSQGRKYAEQMAHLLRQADPIATPPARLDSQIPMNLLPVPFTAAAPQACPDPLWPAKTADNCAGERRRPEWRFVNSWQERRVVLPEAIEAPVVGKATWVDVIRTP